MIDEAYVKQLLPEPLLEEYTHYTNQTQSWQMQYQRCQRELPPDYKGIARLDELTRRTSVYVKLMRKEILERMEAKDV